MKPIVSLLIVITLTGTIRAQAPRWVRTGHYGSITGLAFSRDGRYLASIANRDNCVLIWDVKNPYSDPMLLLDGPRIVSGYYTRPSFTTVTFSPDGKSIFTDRDSTITKWDVTSGAKLWQRRFPFEIAKLKASYSGDTLGWISENGTASLYEVQKGKIIDSIAGITTPNDISDDLNTVVSETLDNWNGGFELWNYSFSTGGAGMIWQADPAYALVISSDARQVAISYWTGAAIVNLQTGNSIPLAGGYHEPFPILFSSTGDSVIYKADSLRIFDTRTSGISVFGHVQQRITPPVLQRSIQTAPLLRLGQMKQIAWGQKEK